MKEVLREVNELIALLEAEIPANPSSPKNLRLRKRLEGDMAKYFNSLGDAFPYSSLEKIYNKYVQPD